jgi:hypothetical protein
MPQNISSAEFRWLFLLIPLLIPLLGCTGEPVGSAEESESRPASSTTTDSPPAKVPGSMSSGAVDSSEAGRESLKLIYKFSPGSSFRDRLRVSVKSAAGPNEVTLTTETTSEWTVLEAIPAKGGKLSRRVLTVKADIVTQSGVFVYDSETGAEPANPLWVNAYGPEVKSQLRHNLHCWVSPHGEVSDVEYVGDGVAPSIEELVSRAKLVFDPLPEEPVLVGQPIVRREIHRILGQQIFETATITLKSVEMAGNSRTAVFDVAADMKAEAAPKEAPVLIGYVDSPFQEQFVFDLDNGRILRKTASNKRFIEQSLNGIRIRQSQEIHSEYQVVQ